MACLLGWELASRPWPDEVIFSGWTVAGGIPIEPSGRICWPAASETSTLRGILETLTRSLLDEASSSAVDSGSRRFVGSLGSSWHKCPILRFIHRVQGRSFTSGHRSAGRSSHTGQAASNQLHGSSREESEIKRGRGRTESQVICCPTRPPGLQLAKALLGMGSRHRQVAGMIHWEKSGGGAGIYITGINLLQDKRLTERRQ